MKSRGVLEERAAYASRRGTRLEDAYGLVPRVNSWVPDKPTGITANASLLKGHYNISSASKLDFTHHGAIAEKCPTSAERVREDIKWRHGARLEVPERTPSRVVVDLEGVIRCTVEEDNERGREYDRLERNDPRCRILEVELPLRSLGGRKDDGSEEGEEREQ